MEDPAVLAGTVATLGALADERWRLAETDPAAEARARRLRDHVATYLLPRLRSLERPVLVTVLGPTGAGKSSLVNALVGRPVSATGVIRPTTRRAVVVATADDAAALAATGALEPVGGAVETIEVGSRPGVVLVDAPDIDSLEHANRLVAEALLEASDLVIFVTSAVRYADRVPWEILGRARDRGVPLVVVVNRAPADAEAAASVVEDLSRLLGETGLAPLLVEGGLGIVTVAEGRLAPGGAALDAASVAPVTARTDRLEADRTDRRRLVGVALAGALAGIRPLVREVADDLEHAAIDAEAARRGVALAYEDELRALRDELRGGRFLRDEVLREWHAFVGADQVTRFFSTGIGRIRGTVAGLLHGTPPVPVGAVETETARDLVALTGSHVAAAARRAASRWRGLPRQAASLAADPGLWTSSPGLSARLETAFRGWLAGVGDDVRRTAEPKRRLARGASLGVNAAGVAVIVSVFAHTGGITGAEAGLAAGTAVLNQRLLDALFGEAAVAEMIGRARRSLDATVDEAFASDRARFDALVAEPAVLRDLAADLRGSADGLGA